MNLWQRFSEYFQKESWARTVSTLRQVGQPVMTPANYESFSKVGYQKNVVVYSCINKIATACAGISWSSYEGVGKNRTELLESPVLKLIQKPNPLQASSSFFEAVIGYYLLAGNSYIEANNGASENVNKPYLELWPARPDKMKIIGGTLGYPAAYEFSSGEARKRWPVDQVSYRSLITHWKSFHPTNDWYGLSKLEAAMLSVDQNNAGQRWNLSLLQNSASPSGVLQMKATDANPRGELTDEQYRRLKSEFETSYQGAKNAGRPLIIEGGLQWASMSLSPREMDWLKSKEITANDIAAIYGVPPELLGLGQKTFNNYKEARLSFYEDTVLPLMDSLRDALNMGVAPAFSDSVYLDYDVDDIEALVEKREEKYTSINGATFLTQNEKREAVGYEPKEGWDVFLIGNQLVESPDDLTQPTPFGAPSDEPNQDEPQEDPEDDEAADESQDQTEDDAAIEDEDDGKSFKAINLVNANEKRKSARRQNAIRKTLTKEFSKDVNEDLDALTEKYIQATKGLRDPKILEFAMLKVLNEFEATLEKTIAKHIKITVDEFGRMVFKEAKHLGFDKENKANRRFEDFTKRYTSTRSGQAISTIQTTQQKQIRKVIGEWVQETIEAGDTLPDLSKFIQAEFEELTPAQATRIARTEVAMASNNATREAVKSLQIPNMVKEWVTAEDDRVRDGEHGGADHEVMNGAEVPLDEKFGVPPDALMDGPGDPAGGADQVINCRCALVFKSKG